MTGCTKGAELIMLKIRLHGKNEEIEKIVQWLELQNEKGVASGKCGFTTLINIDYKKIGSSQR